MKLDLGEYERGVLRTLLKTEIERGERDGTADSPWHGAVVRIAVQLAASEDSDVTEILDDEDEEPTGQRCGYCGGRAIPNEDGTGMMHADHGDRVKVGGPGDMVSARHNVAGTPILAVDLVDDDDDDDDDEDPPEAAWGGRYPA